MNIYGWAQVQGGTHWYRIREPLRGLAGIGHATEFGDHLDNHICERNNVILTHILHNPEAMEAWQDLVKAKQHLLVYDIDDDIWAYPVGSEQREYWTKERLELASEFLTMSSLVTTPSQILAQKIKYELALHDRVEVIPNFVPDVITTWKYTSRRKFVIGWQPAPQPIHQADFDTIQAQIFWVLQRCPDAELLMFGQPRKPHYKREAEKVIIESAGKFGQQIRTVPWTTDVWRYYRSLQEVTVGLAPLVGGTFTDSKSAIRAVEYCALGITGLYADRPPYRGWIKHRGNGYMINTNHNPNEWRRWLLRLYDDPLLTEQISFNARRSGKEWTTETNAFRWADAFESARVSDASVPSH